MSRSRSLVFLKRLLLLGVLVVSSIAVVAYVRWAIKIDAFAQYRPGENPSLAQQVGVRLEDVKLWHWTNGKLAIACDVGRVDVRRDRQHLDFYEVTNGVYYGAKQNFHFAGPKANYDAGFQMFQVSSGARVWNADLDLKSEGMVYRQKIARLQTQGAVTGRLFDGQVNAMNLMYWPEEKMYEAGPISWEGKLKGSAIQEVTGQGASKPWKVKADHTKRQGDIEYYDAGEATDGEIIVNAPKLERNVKTDVLTATGGVKYYSKKANLICEKAVIYRKEKRAVLTGNVSMLIKPEDQEKLEVVEIQPFRPMVPDEIAASRPKPPPAGLSEAEKKRNEELRSSKTAKKYPTSITAEKIEYWYMQGKRRAIASGTPQARQDFPNGRWRHMWTNMAYYDAENETLKLVSSESKKDTRVMTSIGDDLVAEWFLTSTKENGEDQYEGKGIEGTVVSEDEDMNRRNQGTGQPPPSRLRGPIGRGR